MNTNTSSSEHEKRGMRFVECVRRVQECALKNVYRRGGVLQNLN